MNLKIFLNIQWIFFILFYGWCSSSSSSSGSRIINSKRDFPQVEASAIEAANAKRYREELKNGNNFEERAGLTKTFRKLEKQKDFEEKSVEVGEEHEHYGIHPTLEAAFNNTFGYRTDDLQSNVKNDIEAEAYNRLSSHEQDMLGIRRTVPGWNGEPARRVSDNGNKDHQNNNETDETDDYEYKIANQDGPLMPPLMSSEKADSTEINDMVAAHGQRFTGESTVTEKKSTLGWLKRKLFSIEGDSVADDRDDADSDYKADKRRKVGYAGEFTRRRGHYRDEDDDYPNKHGVPAGDDYYHQSDNSHADVSKRSNRYAADMGDTATYWNNANRKRESVQEEQGRVDSRNSDKAINRRRKSAKPVGSEMPTSDSTSKKQETPPDQQTVYRQQYDDSDQMQGTTPCDCAAKCATEESIDTSSEEPETTDSDNGTENETTEKAEEEGDEEDEKSQEDEIEEEKEEPVTEENVEESSSQTTQNELDHQKEVYIDLRIGIKSVGNQSSSTEDEPIEFHKKIVVKREEFENDKSSTFTSSLAPESKFPVDLVKAIYQLVDKDDSLRKHVAPRLPDRTKLLSKLEQPGHKQKINDRQLESTRGGSSDSKALAKIEDNASSNKALASVIEAIGELIRKRT